MKVPTMETMPLEPSGKIKQRPRNFSSRAEQGECYLLLVDHTLGRYSISKPMPLPRDDLLEAFQLDGAWRDVSITLVEGHA
jgi:hypothetical protein